MRRRRGGGEEAADVQWAYSSASNVKISRFSKIRLNVLHFKEKKTIMSPTVCL